MDQRIALIQIVSGATMPKSETERYRLEHLSMMRWIALAKQRGWDGGEEGFDELREFAEPEDAALVQIHDSLAKATKAAKNLFKKYPNDSVFGAIIITLQSYEEAHDDQGNLIEDCPPEWEDVKGWEVCSDGSVSEFQI